MPFWKAVFAHGQMDVDYVLVIRHPLSVCDSLAKRDGFDVEKSHLLWLEHVVGSLAGTEGEDRVLIDYDFFMQTPEGELARIAKEFQLSINIAELQNFQFEFLDHQLQHTIYQLNELMLDGGSPPLVQEVYSALLGPATGTIGLENSPVKDKIAQWDKEFSRMRSALIMADKLGTKLAATTAERNALNAERNMLLHEKAQMTQAFMAKEQAVQKLRVEIQAVHQSRLWRWTQPLRRLFSLFQPPK